MVRFKATTGDGRVLIGLGITSANVARMAQGEPIHVKGESVNTPGIDICIFYGKSLEDLQRQLEPMIGEETQVHLGLVRFVLTD